MYGRQNTLSMKKPSMAGAGFEYVLTKKRVIQSIAVLPLESFGVNSVILIALSPGVPKPELTNCVSDLSEYNHHFMLLISER